MNSPLNAYLISQLSQALKYLDRLHVRNNIEILHQYRVHLRRTLSLLTLFTPTSRHMIVLKPLIKESNEIRDLDVFIEEHLHLLRPKEQLKLKEYRHKKFKKRISHHFRQKAKKEIRATIHALRKSKKQTLSPTKLRKITSKHYQDSLHLYNMISETTSLDERHKIRLLFKTSRYALTFIRESKIARFNKAIKMTKKIQKELGALQDINQQSKLIEKLYEKKIIKKSYTTLNEKNREALNTILSS